jgi:hypothetical protein
MSSSEMGIIAVRKPGNTGQRPTKLMFADHEVYRAAKRKLERSPTVEVTDAFWGYALCDSVERAMDLAEFWCR